MTESPSREAPPVNRAVFAHGSIPPPRHKCLSSTAAEARAQLRVPQAGFPWSKGLSVGVSGAFCQVFRAG